MHHISWKLDILLDNPDHPALRSAVVDSRGGEVNSGRDVDRERKDKIKRMYLAEFDYEAGKHAGCRPAGAMIWRVTKDENAALHILRHYGSNGGRIVFQGRRSHGQDRRL